MDQSGKVKTNIRVLLFIISLPFWALLAANIYGVWLGDSFSFEVMHILIIAMAYIFFQTVVLGRNPAGKGHDPQH